MSGSYVEVLRVQRALRIVVVLLGIILLGAFVARFSFAVPTSSKAVTSGDYYAGLERSPTAHVTRMRLPNGRSRTIVDDPKKEVYAIIDRRGSSVVSFTFAHTKAAAEERQRNPGSTGTTTAQTHEVAYTVVGEVFWLTLPMGLLVATLLGGPLSKENNGHLEAAWTKPVSRERYAVGAMLADILGILVAQAMSLVAVFTAFCFWSVPKLNFNADDALVIALMAVGPIAWFAFLTALSTSVKRGPGIVLGIGWALAVVVPSVASWTSPTTTPLGHAVHGFFAAVNYLVPTSYILENLGGVIDPKHQNQIALATVSALAVVYLWLALLQWRRVEA